MTTKLAIIATHPVQYHSPWFRFIAARAEISLRVFYLWDFGVTNQLDPGFRQTLQWDIPLLSGYDYEFVPNESRAPGTHRFFGLRNPSLIERVRAYAPDAVLMFGYNFASCLEFILRWPYRDIPLIFRGDSHRLAARRGAIAGLRRHAISSIFRRFAAVLYVGSANLEYFRLHGVAQERLFHAPHAVDNERFMSEAPRAEQAAAAWKRELGIPSGHSVILFAGKWDDNKRPLDLLHAFERARLADASLLFVGAGPQEKQLKAAAEGHPDVYFAPFQNQTLMPRTYCSGDVFVLPSRSETWGLAVNEAMCMGRAVIVSDHVGCASDLVVARENGLVFPAGDTGALAECLKYAVSDRQRLEQWGERSRSRIRDYSYETATAGLMRALERLGVPRPSGA